MGMFDFVKSLFSNDDDDDDVNEQAWAQMANDRNDPRKAFVWGVLCCTEDMDPGYLPDYAHTAATEWYGIESAQEIVDMKHDHFRASGVAAYDCFRLCFVARCGYGAGLLDEATSWAVAFKHAAWAQRQYPNWQAFAQGYLEGHLAYRRDLGDSEEEVAEWRAKAIKKLQEAESNWWPHIPYNVAF